MVSLLGSSWPHRGWFWLWPLVPLVWFLVLFTFVRIFFWRGRRGAWAGACGGSRRPSAEAILAERYARGEIGHEEYRDRLGRLQG